jgi:hypothetical protein
MTVKWSYMLLDAWGLAYDWWDAYTAAHPAPNTITWQ